MREMDVLLDPDHPAVLDADTQRDFWLTLAAALLPPLRPGVLDAFHGALPDDLERLGRRLGMDVAQEVASLREACGDLPDDTALQLEYSRLFLPPATAATLNLARYVDSGIGGACMDALELAYATHGLATSEVLRDLPDHASFQFEALAWLAGSAEPAAAAEFAHLCLAGALPRLLAALRGAAPRSPYTALVSIASTAVRQIAGDSAEGAPERRNLRHELSRGVWRHCDDCGKPYAREKEIRIMQTALERAGLPSAHLVRCPDCRDRAQGFFRRGIA